MSTQPNINQLPKSLQPQTQPSPFLSEDNLRLMLENHKLNPGAGLLSVVKTQIEMGKLPYYIDDNGNLQDALKGSDLHLKKFITVDPDTLSLKLDIPKYAKCQDEVLIHGETGTGKEIIARSMIGDRTGKCLALNCAGMPSELLESELFGHVRGAFTGATNDKTGLCKVADDGVLFMDEIGELPLFMQAKLLRVIQDRTIRKVGGKDEEPINCKFVFATNKNIPEMVRLGTFRQDLYARISTLELSIKPLRERTCDIEPIIASMPDGKQFLQYCVNNNIRPERDLSLQHNVRSLHQYVRRFKVLGTVKVIS